MKVKTVTIFGALFVAMVLVVSQTPATAQCTGDTCQAQHTASDGTAEPSGNDCITGSWHNQDGNWNFSDCVGGSYAWIERLDELQNLVHAQGCVNTVNAPCIPCAVGIGGTKVCPQFAEQVNWHRHQKFNQQQMKIYDHTWKTPPTKRNCECNNHGCTGAPPP